MRKNVFLRSTVRQPVRALVWDEQLRQVVAPLERSIRLMESLYPIAVILSLVIAAGLSALLTVMSAKEGAILRVMGTSRLRTTASLSLQIVFVCLAGLLLSAGLLLGLFPVIFRETDLQPIERSSLLYIGAYQAAASIAAAFCAGISVRRNPLELLQVKE